jgi:uncharacterized protein (TIGR00369 family)
VTSEILLGAGHLYDYLGVASRALDDSSGETTMPVGDHMRVGGMLRAAPLGLAFEQGVATYLYKRVMAVPVQISLRVCDTGSGVQSVRSTTRSVREGRTLVFIDGEIRDGDNPDRLVAFGTIIWSVIGEAPNTAEADPDSRPPWSSTRIDIMDAIGATPLPDGTGARIGGVAPQLAGPGGVLHAGVFQLLCEDAALTVTREQLNTGNRRAVDCTFNFLQPGRVGPFTATADVVRSDGRTADCRIKVRDQGSDNRLCAYSTVRVEMD